MSKKKTKSNEKVEIKNNTKQEKDKESTIKEENMQMILDERKNKEKLPKEISQEILKKIIKNLIFAIVIMVYFIVSNLLYTKVQPDQMTIITKVFSGIFLLSSIILFEISYKKDSGILAITAIEVLVLSIYSLFINHIVKIYKFDFREYLLTSTYIFAIYYVLKSIIIYTRARIKHLKSLSDISEIIKDEPVIKEATKKNKEEEKKENNEQKSDKHKEIKPKSIRMKNRSKKQNKNDKDNKEELNENSNIEIDSEKNKKESKKRKNKKKEVEK